MEPITWSDFEKVELRAGPIISVEDFPEAKSLRIKSRLTLVSLELKKSSEQITAHYTKIV